MKRYTFVVQVHPDGISTLENLSTQERIRLADLAEVGPQIERWLLAVGGRPPVREGLGRAVGGVGDQGVDRAG